MKKYIIIILLSLIPFITKARTVSGDKLIKYKDVFYIKFSNKPFTGTLESYYNNRQLRERGQLIHGKFDGNFRTYHENGNFQAKAILKAGKPKGLWETYHENGKLWTKENYKEDNQDGLSEEL